MKEVTNVENGSQTGKKPKNQSVRKCIYCLEANPHTKSCHVIARSIEMMRFGITDRNGGIIRQSIDGKLGLKETRIDRGKFWCDVCEEKIGGIDDQFIPEIKRISNFFIKYGRSTVINVNDKDINSLLINGIGSILIRNFLYKRQDIPPEIYLLNKLELIGCRFLIEDGTLLSTIIRVDCSNMISWCDINKVGFVSINFNSGYSLIFIVRFEK